MPIRAGCIFLLSILPFTFVWANHTDEKYTIGVLYWSTDIPCQLVMGQGVDVAASDYNIWAKKTGHQQVKLLTFVAGDGEDGIERQIKQMYALIAKKVDLIIVQPADNAALAKPLQAANREDIPVIAYDQYISGGKLRSFISSDNYQAGYLGGEYIASKFDNNDEVKVILVDYPHVSSTVSRVDGFLDALTAQQQNYKILKTYEAIESVSGYQVAQKILHDYPHKSSIDVLFSVNDGAGLSIVETLLDEGRNEIMVASVDGDPIALEYVKNNDIMVINAAQFCAAIGKEAFLTAIDALQGNFVAVQKMLPVFPVTKETFSLYPGWHGVIPAEFSKPWKSTEPVWSGDTLSKIVLQ